MREVVTVLSYMNLVIFPDSGKIAQNLREKPCLDAENFHIFGGDMNILWLHSRHGLNNFEQIALMFVLIAAFISLAYAWWLRGTVLKKDKGTAKMQEIWNAIRIGANSYLDRQLKTILPLIGVLTLVMFFSVYVVPPSLEATQVLLGGRNSRVIQRPGPFEKGRASRAHGTAWAKRTSSHGPGPRSRARS